MQYDRITAIQPATSVSGAKPVQMDLIKVDRQTDRRSKDSEVNSGAVRPDNGKVNDEIQESLASVNKALDAFNIEARFSVHKETGQVIVRLLNTKTGDIIREIPPERLLDLVTKMRELVGMLIDERA